MTTLILVLYTAKLSRLPPAFRWTHTTPTKITSVHRVKLVLVDLITIKTSPVKPPKAELNIILN